MVQLETIAARPPATQPASRVRDLSEIGIGYILILAVIWTERPIQRVIYWIAIAVILAFILLRRDTPRQLGLTGYGFLRSLWIPGLALLLAAIGVFAAARLHTLRFRSLPTMSNLRFTGYAIWSFVQQFLLQNFFLLRLRLVTSRPALAAVLAAVLFAAAHIPNPLLMTLTLVWGVLACLLFLRYGNLYTLGMAHAILGICVAVTTPNYIQRHMRVGVSYLHYHPRTGHRHPPQP